MTLVLDDIAALLGLAEGLAWAAVLVFTRIGAMVALLPGLGDMAVPVRVKLALVLVLTIVVTPLVAGDPGAVPLAPSLFHLGGEVVAGLILGIGPRLVLLALQTAAAIIAQSTTLSQLFNGVSPEPQPAIGALFLIAGTALALSFGLHVRAAELVVLSYDVLPAGQLPRPA